ncbi:uncharacterized protein E0L32_003676 [Thyridium curvatum]|uniref:Uncharacterized protein n=1 Tax=Thyridium curvatum TaxID=1093900 RepID=A0A507B0X9_9PEZI|nr:uncharacterized protein E0L32_003676 [Thyridium curvatum]TPX16735.1 hypothetical protein E0L32_003676 [Thyridium curvatum]
MLFSVSRAACCRPRLTRAAAFADGWSEGRTANSRNILTDNSSRHAEHSQGRLGRRPPGAPFYRSDERLHCPDRLPQSTRLRLPTPRHHFSALFTLIISEQLPCLQARSTPRAVQTANIISLPTPTADFVQELYLKELKAYKTPAVKESDAQGHVSTFSLPKTPKSPEEADLASSLKEYESMAVEVEGQEAGAAGAQSAAVVEDWLVEEEEEEAHH